jgi:hypothetical protein
MADQKAETVMNTLIDSIILEYGVPERVLTDQGTNFLSQTMDTLYKQLGIERLRTTAYRPCCDGMVERFNRTMADIIASYVINQPDTWDTYIKYATFAYNTSVHSSTGYTPFYLLKGFEAREPNDVLPAPRLLILSDPNNIFAKMWHEAKAFARQNLEAAQEKQKDYYDKNTKTVKYNIGDIVLLRDLSDQPGKFNMRWKGPYRVIEQKGDVNFKLLDLSDNSFYVTHVDRMKLFSKEPSRDSNHTETTEPELVIPTEALANEIKQPVTQPASETIENKPIKERRSKSEERPLLPPRRNLRRTLTLPLKLREYDLTRK